MSKKLEEVQKEGKKREILAFKRFFRHEQKKARTRWEYKESFFNGVKIPETDILGRDNARMDGVRLDKEPKSLQEFGKAVEAFLADGIELSDVQFGKDRRRLE